MKRVFSAIYGSWMGVLLACGTHATFSFAEPLICSNPVKAVCGRSEWIEKPLPKTLSTELEKRSGDPKAWEAYRNRYNREMYRLIGAPTRTSALEVRRRIRNVYAEIRSLKIDELLRLQDGGVSQNLARILKELRLVIGTDLPDATLNYSQIEDWKDYCGVDGLQANSAYLPDPNSLIFCPANLIGAGRDWEARARLLVSHEIGHAIGERASRVAARDLSISSIHETTDRYKKTFSCLKNHYASALSVRWPKNPRARRISRQDMTQNTIEEWVADVHAANDLAFRLLGLDDGDREKEVSGALDQFCVSGDDVIGKTTRYADETHPGLDVRIEHFLRHPKIRHLLGCAPLSASSRPWCGFDELHYLPGIVTVPEIFKSLR